jgi:chemotaxis protein CheD
VHVMSTAYPIERIIVGQVSVSATPRKLSTIVGSCVAACVFDPVMKIGGMNHFLLPQSPHGSLVVDTVFGIHAMDELLSRLLRAGAIKRRLLAKVFGGCNSPANNGVHWQAGAANCDFVIQALMDLDIPVMAKSLGGNHGRAVCLTTHTGDVLVKPIQSLRQQRLITPAITKRS